jgi:hypothetical protein
MAGAFGLDINTFMDPDEPKRRTKTDDPDLFSSPDDRRLWRQFQRLKKLPEHDQTTVLRMLNTLADARTANA